MVRFIVTGFGTFCGVPNNPTEVLVTWLDKQHQQNQHQQHRPCSSFTVESCQVLEVAAAAVDSFLEQQQQLLLVKQATDKRPVVLLHLGVDTQRPGLNLECQAFNNATFRCPDQRGWQPTAAQIEPGLDVHCVRSTSLPLQQLAQELQAAGFDNVQVSNDAGRFVCNFTYFRSLQLSNKLQQHLQAQEQAAGSADSTGAAAGSSSGSVAAADVTANSSSSSSSGGGNSSDGSSASLCYSLFVHVPPFEVVSEERQKAFVLQLLHCIARCLSEVV